MTEENKTKNTQKKVGIASLCAIALLGMGGISYSIFGNESKEQPKSEVKQQSKKEDDTTMKKKNKKADDPLANIVEDDKSDFYPGEYKVENKKESTPKKLLDLLASATEVQENKDSKKAEAINKIPEGVKDLTKPTEEFPNKPLIPSPPEEIGKPSISGKNVVVSLNSEFDPLDYVSATDTVEGNLTSKISYDTNELDTSQNGHYSVYYSVTNKSGIKAKKTIEVTVNSAPHILPKQFFHFMSVNETFNPLDFVSASHWEQGDLTSQVTYKTDLNTHLEGRYMIEYSVTDKYGYKSNTVKMTIFVSNEAPVIHAEDTTLHVGDTFDPMSGITATDKESGNLTDKIQILSNTVDTSKEGTYSVEYSVEDGNSKTTTLKRTVQVVNDAPVIHASDKVYHIGDIQSFIKEMALEGVAVTDTEDDKNGIDLTSKVEVDEVQLSEVNVSAEGEYPLTYRVSDSFGKQSEKTVLVKIINDAPIIEVTDIHVPMYSKALSMEQVLKNINVTDTEDDKAGIAVNVQLDEAQFNSVNYAKEGIYSIEVTALDRHGKVSKKSIQIIVENVDPILLGVNDLSITVGTSFDPLEGISATDKDGNPIELTVENVTGTVDTKTAGQYELTYTVSDKVGNTVSAKRTVTVIEK